MGRNGAVSEDGTLFDRAARQLRALCRVTPLAGREDACVEDLRRLCAGWSDHPVDAPVVFRSDVSDDHTPYELSISIAEDGRADVRVLVEAQGEPPSLATNWEAACLLTRRLAEDHGASVARLDRVCSLFEPTEAAKLAMWHAARFRPEGGVELKAYFDAQARGRGRAAACVEGALARLGFARAWAAMGDATRRGWMHDELRYFALDLVDDVRARAKVYVRHHGITVDEIEELFGAPGFMPRGEASRFVRAMTGSEGPYRARPLFTCTSFVDPDSARASERTLYVPIAAYTAHDADARARIEGYLAGSPAMAAAYTACIEAHTARDLSAGGGLHAYVGLRAPGGARRVTTYLAPETHGAVTRPSPPPPRAPEPPEEIVRRYEHDLVLVDHPFFQRLGREPVDLGHLWLTLANFWEAIVHDFPARLARVVAAVSDDAVRCVLVKQLNDELGEGDFSRAHKPMFRRLVDALEPYRMAGDDAVLLAPGRVFGRALERHLFDGSEHEAIGALMMIEVYGKQTDVRLGQEFARQRELDPAALQWLHLHEELEVDHADDSARLARLLPADPEVWRAAWRGADGVVVAGHAYFDALYRVCFG